jgi:penicillin amidase
MRSQHGRDVNIWRDEHGVPHVEATNENDLYWGQGVVHATDRAMQMLLMRILGQGRVCELLDPSDASLRMDTFFRRMNWAGNVSPQMEKLTYEGGEHLASYCEGVNFVLLKKCPWEFRLLGYRPEPWRPEHTIMISRMVGYVTLQQSQAEMERLFVQMVQAGIADDKLEELFPGLLEGLDRELLNKVRLAERVVPSDIVWQAGVPRMMASNNWVVSGAKTASGKPLLCNDPHLEGNRLPNVWCEVALHTKDRYAIGASMPGGPGIIVGRNPDVAWGATYAFADAVDSWVERCQEGKYFRELDQWLRFRGRREIIKRKKKEPVEVVFHENEHGVLDGDPSQDGYYLATRWAAGESGAATICRILEMWDVKTVEEAMDTLGRVETAWSFVFADRHGDIGYQMSGLVPRRRPGISGLVPLPGWKKENDWKEIVSHDELPRAFNPDERYFVTANQDLNRYGKAAPINMPMGPYRAERIDGLLEEGQNLTPTDMFEMHYDVYSPQAEKFMEILKPLLPETSQGEILREWDCRYTAESRGAYLFEAFYRRLLQDVLAAGGIGENVAAYLANETGMFADFYFSFDRVLLSNDSAWFGGESRGDVYRRVAEESLSIEPRPWGEKQQFVLRHLLFGGKLPKFLGFDRGPVTVIGGRATVHQGQIYRNAGRTTSFVPSFRFVADLSNDDFFSNLAGGPSDRRFSKWYCSDLKNWLSGKYKQIPSGPAGKKRRFK